MSKYACLQRASGTSIQKIRGEILDKNNIKFTNRNAKMVIAIKPLLLRSNHEIIHKISNILEINFEKLKKEIEFKKEPILVEIKYEQREKILEIDNPGVSIINYLDRFDQITIARHVIGYLNKTDHTGVFGLEKFYDNYLKTSFDNTVSAIVDAKNNVLQGIGYRISTPNPYKLNIKTTLDFHIQKIIEDVLSTNNITGAVVVEDIATGDIVAMGSSPCFEQNAVHLYLHSNKNELFNRAVAAYSIGSIFKVIDVAEAIEQQNFKDRNFFCNGSIKIQDKEFKCCSYKSNGHGYVNLKEAFAYSCNPYFIELGLKLGYKNIIKMAEKFGMGKPTGIFNQGVQESPGNLELGKDFFTYGDVANASIGQGNIMASPIQVADIIATIANDGIRNKVNIVDSVVDDENKCVKKLRQTSSTRVISKSSAETIKNLMKEVTTMGTGTKARLENTGGSAGKTSSAETGQYIGGEKVVHAWFAGYFPLAKPKYSIAVLIENGKSGGQSAAPIFAQIAEQIVQKKL